MTYATLNNGVLSIMSAPKYISNPTDEQLAAYATEQGYKPLETSTAPSKYHIKGYEETDDAISTIWTAPELDSLKVIKKAEAESSKDQALASTSTLEVEEVGSVIYNQDALINVMGLLLAQSEQTSYVLADDSVTTLSLEQVGLVSKALSDYRAQIYATKAARFDAIDACDDVDELLSL